MSDDKLEELCKAVTSAGYSTGHADDAVQLGWELLGQLTDRSQNRRQMSDVMVCNQQKCDKPAGYRFTWPGHDEAGICKDHVGALTGLAAAMGFDLQVIPLSGEDDAESSA